MSDDLKPLSNEFDDAFRQRFRHPSDQQVRSDVLYGHSFESISRVQSRWSDVRADNGFLTKDFDLTVVNPDRSAAISFLEVTGSRYLHYMQAAPDAFRDVRSFIHLSVFPNDPKNFSDSALHGFARALRDQMPAAAFVRSMTENTVSINGSYGPHAIFVQNLIGRDMYASGGLCVVDLSGSKYQTSFSQLVNSPALSGEASVRAGFREYLQPLLHRTAALPQLERSSGPVNSGRLLEPRTS